jgi:hypothetical protein
MKTFLDFMLFWGLRILGILLGLLVCGIWIHFGIKLYKFDLLDWHFYLSILLFYGAIRGLWTFLDGMPFFIKQFFMQLYYLLRKK